ncbi:hypothetical protein AB0F17_03715 [Nonomuraea sp. NPDC026600]|uniref:hypothetical protein n=1 Tax=Nonomuraea sp. NPDC026600 TaxID=3155363 RepID=UPI0034003F64
MERTLPVLLPGERPDPSVGDHPWLLAGPLAADLTNAERGLGYRCRIRNSVSDGSVWTCG